jgi:hypothetical protein
MPSDPAELIFFATWLDRIKPNPPSEILIRTIINRAYYAALISASRFTCTPTNTKENKGGHVNVINALKRHNMIVGNKLNALRLKRHEADYEFHKNLSVQDASVSLLNSREILYSINPSLPALEQPTTTAYIDISKF